MAAAVGYRGLLKGQAPLCFTPLTSAYSDWKIFATVSPVI